MSQYIWNEHSFAKCSFESWCCPHIFKVWRITRLVYMSYKILQLTLWSLDSSQADNEIAEQINKCFVHPIFRFWFLVTFGDEVTKIRKYYIIFVYILQGKMGRMEKNGKKITQLKWPKYQKPKDENMGWTKQKCLLPRAFSSTRLRMPSMLDLLILSWLKDSNVKLWFVTPLWVPPFSARNIVCKVFWHLEYPLFSSGG